jgi:hypothetical protein
LVFGVGDGSVFAISSGASVDMAGFVIQHGAATQGGGIANAGTLGISDTYVGNNEAVVNGGGIYNSGTLTLDNVDVNSNVAGVLGGGNYNAGALTLTGGTLVFANSAGTDGGGVFNAGTTSLCDAFVVGNAAGEPPRTNNFSGSSPIACTVSSPSPIGSNAGGRGAAYLVSHAGRQLCLPDTALKPHVRHGDVIIARGCSRP